MAWSFDPPTINFHLSVQLRPRLCGDYDLHRKPMHGFSTDHDSENIGVKDHREDR